MERLFAETVGRLENRVQQLETLGTTKPGEHRTVRSLGKGASARHTPLGLGRDKIRYYVDGRGTVIRGSVKDTHWVQAAFAGHRPDRA
jgi:hypothetical protein